MTYDLRFHADFFSDLKNIPLPAQIRILEAAESLADDPRPMGVKKLSGIKRGKDNVYRVRVGNYRIGYRIFDRELFVFVITAAERGKIYTVLKRRLR